MKQKVFVGLSGGVDSAVSAALLVRAGYDVTGVFIRIVVPGYPCTAALDRQEAMRVAAHLKIPFKEVDLSAAYKEKVFEYSLREFAAGRTPNPDTLCNREIKFGLFFDWCIREGADMVATGHYAQSVPMRHGHAALYAGVDDKDQSYFLWMVPEQALARTRFPVGNLRKTKVRALANRFGLPNAARKDSQGLCFLGPISIQDMLSAELHPTPGDVLSESGEVVGRHNGALLYTLGQRHGFSLTHTAGSEQAPMYVVGKDLERNTIVVSPHQTPQDATKTVLTLAECNWIGTVRSGTYQARYRYRQEVMSAHLELTGTGAVVTLAQPQYAPLGQSVVLYDGTRCLGGGVIIESTLL